MPDVFLAYAFQDADFAVGLADSLSGRGLELGRPLSFWPGAASLPEIDHGLTKARRCVVIVSRHFLLLGCERKTLDGIAGRAKVVSLLHGVEESDVATHSARLAVSAIPGSMAEGLVRLLRE